MNIGQHVFKGNITDDNLFVTEMIVTEVANEGHTIYVDQMEDINEVGTVEGFENKYLEKKDLTIGYRVVSMFNFDRVPECGQWYPFNELTDELYFTSLEKLETYFEMYYQERRQYIEIQMEACDRIVRSIGSKGYDTEYRVLGY